MKSLFILAGVLFYFCQGCSVLSNDSQQKSINDVCSGKKAIVICPCGRFGAQVSVQIDLCGKGDNKTGEITCLPCDETTSTKKVCKPFRECETCITGLNKCHTCPEGYIGSYCTEIDESFNALNESFPIIVSSSDEKLSNKNRLKRALHGCPFPEVMDHGEYKCWIWPSWIKCDLHCLFGYTMPQGLKKRIACRPGRGWYPSDWEACKPYIDCSIRLKSAGSFNCVYDMTTPSYCYIECESEGKKPHVHSQKYICDHHWEPELPHCIESVLEPVVSPPKDLSEY